MKLARFIFGKSNSSSTPRLMVLAFDIVLVLLSICFVMLMKFFPEMYSTEIYDFLKGSISVIAVFSIAFIISGSYKGMVRYTGFQDIEKIVKVTTMVFIILCIFKSIFEHTKAFGFLLAYLPSYTNILLICTMTLFFTVLTRLVLRRIYNEYLRPHPKIINTIIYGAGDAGIITYNAISQDGLSQYNIVSFIDDSNSKVGSSINGIKIRKPEVVFDKKFIKEKNIETVILTLPTLTLIWNGC